MSYTMICAISYILGIYVAREVSISYVLIFAVVGICVAIIKGIVSKELNLSVILAVFMLSAGISLYKISAYNELYDKFPDEMVTITGTIVSAPEKDDGEYYNKYILAPETIALGEQSVKSDKNIIIRTEEPDCFGDILTVSGKLEQIPQRNNEFEYDYSLYYKGKGIYNQLKAEQSEKIGENSLKEPRYWMGRIRNYIHEGIFERFDGEKAAIYNAVLLGDKSYLSNAYTVRLLRTGVWQSLYSSYIHIIVLALMAGVFKSGKRKNIALFVFLVLYALLNIGNMNAVKASLLVALVILCRMVFGYSDKMQQLAVIVLAIAIINPMLCYSRGFVMSVSSTIILFVFYPIVLDTIYNKLFRKVHIHSRKLASVFAIAVTLVVGNLPIAAYLFNGSAIFSTIITTMLIPVIVALYVLSLVNVPMMCLGDGWGFLFDVTDGLLGFLEKLPDYIEKIPWHYISLKTPSILTMVCAYLVMWLVAQIIDGHKRDAIFKFVSIIVLALMVTICIVGQHPGLKIFFVNVGQGDAAVLNTSNNETILIDGGGAAEYYKGDYNVGDRVLVPYMISHGFSKIDYAVLTHFHKDHAEGIVSAVKNLRVKNIVMPDSQPENVYRATLESLAKEKGINVIYAQKGDVISLDSGLVMTFLAPDEKQRTADDGNTNSIVVQVDYHYFCGLFTGDSDDKVDKDYPRYVDILKVSHHGSKTTNDVDGINHISPKYAIISVGKDNNYGLPSAWVVDYLEKTNAKILRTDILGDIRFKIDKYGGVYYDSLRKE